jgi:hypothetical protein
MIAPANNIGREYESMLRHRSILLATHVVLGLLSGLSLLSQEDFSGYPFWSQLGISALVRPLFASWPYVISGVACYRREGITALRLMVFEVILVAGTGVGVLAYLGKAGLHLEGATILVVSIAQALIFTIAAKLLMPRPLL